MQLFSIDTDFEYIIRKPKQQRICFGSGQSRDISRSGASPFMRYYTAEDYRNVGPGSYNTLKSFNAIKTRVQMLFFNINYFQHKGHKNMHIHERSRSVAVLS